MPQRYDGVRNPARSRARRHGRHRACPGVGWGSMLCMYCYVNSPDPGRALWLFAAPPPVIPSSLPRCPFSAIHRRRPIFAFDFDFFPAPGRGVLPPAGLRVALHALRREGRSRPGLHHGQPHGRDAGAGLRGRHPVVSTFLPLSSELFEGFTDLPLPPRLSGELL